MAYQQNQNDRTTEQPRQQLPVLTLAPEQLAALSALTRKDGLQLAFDPDEIAMILDLCPQCRIADFQRFLYRAAGLGLNPLHNEIHMEYKWSKGEPKATFVVHVDGYRKIADKSGLRAGFKQQPGQDEHGKFVETTVWRKDCAEPFTSRVYFNEFIQTGDYSLYKSKPYHMVAKCGETFAYKQAFPISGLTSEDEIEAWPADQGPRNGADTRLVRDVPVNQNTAPVSPYTVAEKTAEKTAENPAPVPAVNPTPAPAPAPQQAAPAPPVKPSRVLADRLRAIGVTDEELKTVVRNYYPDAAPGARLTQDQYVEAFSATEQWLAENSLAEFRRVLAERAEQEKPQPKTQTLADLERGAAGLPTAVYVPDIFTASANLSAIMAQVAARWPLWNPILCRVATLWCSDHVKGTDALDAVLVANKLTGDNPQPRLEAFLAITRHLAISAGGKVIAFSAATGDALRDIEESLGKAVGKPIRFATDLPKEAVFDAFVAMREKALTDLEAQTTARAGK